MNWLYGKSYMLLQLRHLKKFQSLKNQIAYLKDMKQLPETPYSYTLDDFTDKRSYLRWITQTDQQIGGDSQGKISFQEQNLTFKGMIDPTDYDKLEKTPYVSFTYDLLYGLVLQPFNTLEITAKTDGQPYKVNLFVSSIYDTHHYINATIIDKSKDWQKYKLPFKKFNIVPTTRGDDPKGFLANFGDELKLKKITITRESKEELQFEFKVKEIKLVYDQFMETVVDSLQQSVFMYPSKASQDILTAGRRDVPDIQLYKSLKKKKYVNDFYG